MKISLTVDCIIAAKTMGGFVQAAKADEKFEKEGVGLTITIKTCWCYDSETMDISPYLPKATWVLMEPKDQCCLLSSHSCRP